MPIMIAIPDDCKPLAEAIDRLVACTDRATKRAAGGRALDYAQIEREVTIETIRAARLTECPVLRRAPRPQPG